MEQRSDEALIEELGLRRDRPWSIYDYPNLIRAASIAVFLSLWEFYGRRVDPILFTYPTAIGAAFVQLVRSGELIKQLLVSLSALSAGFGVAIVLGVGLGLLMGRSRLADAVFQPRCMLCPKWASPRF